VTDRPQPAGAERLGAVDVGSAEGLDGIRRVDGRGRLCMQQADERGNCDRVSGAQLVGTRPAELGADEMSPVSSSSRPVATWRRRTGFSPRVIAPSHGSTVRIRSVSQPSTGETALMS
jgi:hypothetical protein